MRWSSVKPVYILCLLVLITPETTHACFSTGPRGAHQEKAQAEDEVKTALKNHAEDEAKTVLKNQGEEETNTLSNDQDENKVKKLLEDQAETDARKLSKDQSEDATPPTIKATPPATGLSNDEAADKTFSKAEAAADMEQDFLESENLTTTELDHPVDKSKWRVPVAVRRASAYSLSKEDYKAICTLNIFLYMLICHHYWAFC